MSSIGGVQFNQPRTAYDEEQARQRHLAYLKVQQRTSQAFQDSARNIALGQEPTPPAMETADEVLGNEGKVDDLAKKYLASIFGTSRARQAYDPNTSAETEDQWLRRTNPAEWVFMQLPRKLKGLLVAEYPSIAGEIKGKDLVTPETFAKYLKTYSQAYDESGGVSKYAVNTKLINDIKALIGTLPDVASITQLQTDIDNITWTLPRNIDRDLTAITRKLEQIKTALPTPAQYQNIIQAVNAGTADVLSRVDDNAVLTAETIITRLNRELDKLPTEAYILQQTEALNHILRDVESQQTAMGRRQLDLQTAINMNVQDLKVWIDDLQENTKGVTPRDMEDLRRLLLSIAQDAEASAQFAYNMGDAEVKAYAERLRKQYDREFREQAGKSPAGKLTKAEESAIKARADRDATAEFNSRRAGGEKMASVSMGERSGGARQQDIRSAFQSGDVADDTSDMTARTTKESVDTSKKTGGVGFNRKMVNPKYARVVGKGLALHEEPKKFYEFGKYMISMPHLADNILKVKYLMNGNEVPAFKATKISPDMTDFIEDLCETQRINERQLAKLSASEKRVFSKLINQSGLYGKYKVRTIKNPEEEEEENRFELVKGQFVAGNDNPAITKELKHLIIKFMLDGRIPKNQGNELLFQLSI